MKKLAILVSLLIVASAHAYVEPVHQRATRRAYRLALQQHDFLTELGVVSALRRGELEYHMQLGSHDEDRGVRPVNHFFDPEHKIGLTVPIPLSTEPVSYVCVAALGGEPANDWALRSVRNDRGLQAANEAHYQAWAAGTQDARDAAIDSLFYTLGHVVHLVQDMAQPEHTRNDQHLFAVGARAPSLYERWTGNNLVLFQLPDGTLTEGFYTGFQIGQGFGDHDALFTAWPGFVKFGLADLTNRNYVTQDTNYSDLGAYDQSGLPRCAGYPLPTLPPTYRRQPFTMTIRDANGNPRQITFFEDIYTKRYEAPRQFDTDAFHTIRSSLDHETGKYDPAVRVFSLDDNSFRSRAANLLPKAVGYSAAVLNRFFRASGTLRASWHRNDDGSFRVALRNYYREQINNARVDIFARTASGALVPMGSGHVANIPCFGCGGAANVSFEGLPPDLIYENDVHVVVQGDVGLDRNAVVGLRDKKKTKLEVEVTYVQTNSSYSELSVSSETLGGGLQECNGCVAASSSDGVRYVTQLLNSRIDKAPFNGRIEAEVGAPDNSRYRAFIYLEATDANVTKQARVRFLKDNAVVAEYQFPYTDKLTKGFNFDWNGAVSIRP